MAATYTVKQVADILGYSTNSIYTFLKEKRIRGVRVGRGRFRVPQEELDRLLTTVKSSNVPSAGMAAAAANTIPAAPVAHTWDVVPGEVTPGRRVEVPNYFEWYLGIASIILGASLSVFSKTFEDAATGWITAMKPTIQTAFIAGGIGLLLTDIRGMGRTYWHKIFYGVLVGTYLVYAAFLYEIQDGDGALFYGGVGLVGVVGWMFGVGGVGRVTLYVLWIMAIAGPVSFVYLPEDIHIAPWLTNLSLFGPLSSIVIAVFSAGSAVIAGLLYLRRKRAYTLMMVSIGLALSLFAFWFAAANYWSRSLFTLCTGFFCLFTPVWLGHVFTHQEDRRAVFGLFSAVTLLYLISIAVVTVFQLNMYEYATGEIRRKLDYARIVIEQILEQNQAGIEGMAVNPAIVRAFVKKDIDALAGVGRGFFDANTSLRRVLFIAPGGDILLYYPLTNTPTITNTVFRDYYTIPFTTKKTYVSDVFVTRTESPVKTVAISAPVLGAGGSAVVGLVVGSLDLDRLGRRLQEFTSDALGEYVTLVDKNGIRMIHPDPALVGTSIAADDAVRLALVGRTGTAESVTGTRDRALTAYGPVGKFGWGLEIKMPLGMVYATTNAASVVIVTILSLTVFCIGLFMATRQFGRVHVVGRTDTS